MSVADILCGLKDKVLDAANYERLRRNFELLEENNVLLKDKLNLQSEEIAKLRTEVLRLSGKVGELQGELDMLHVEDEFVTHEGLAFLKKEGGGVEADPYCPNCQQRLSTVDNRIFICRSCSYVTNASECVADIVRKLSGQA